MAPTYARDEAGQDRAHRPRTRHQPHRHRRNLRPQRIRAHRGPRDRQPSRQRVHRDEVLPRDAAAEHHREARARQRGTARRRKDRPVSDPLAEPDRADRASKWMACDASSTPASSNMSVSATSDSSVGRPPRPRSDGPSRVEPGAIQPRGCASPITSSCHMPAANDRLVIAYSPLAKGLLSGRYDATNLPKDSARRNDPVFVPENVARRARPHRNAPHDLQEPRRETGTGCAGVGHQPAQRRGDPGREQRRTTRAQRRSSRS